MTSLALNNWAKYGKQLKYSTILVIHHIQSMMFIYYANTKETMQSTSLCLCCTHKEKLFDFCPIYSYFSNTLTSADVDNFFF